MTANVPGSRTNRLARLFAFVALSLAGVTCRDSSVTGPGMPTRSNLAVAPRFQVVDGGPRIVLHAVRAELFRIPGGSSAGSAVGTFGSDGAPLELSLAVTLTEAEETFVLRIAATNANGDTVYRSVDSAVVVKRGALPTESVPVELSYSGADVAAVSLATFPEDTVLDTGVDVTFRAEARRADGSVIQAPVGWRSSDSTKLSVTDDGVARAHSEFTGVWLYARTATGLVDSSRVSATRPVGSVVVSPSQPEVITGRQIQMLAAVRASDNSAIGGRPVTWSSSNEQVATVSPTGLVTGITPGTATISANSGGVVGSTLVTVIVPPVASIVLAPADTAVFVGETLKLRATLRDDQNQVLSRTVLWTSLDASIASVDLNTGVITALSAGIARIVATSEGKATQALVRVSPRTAILDGSVSAATFGGTVNLTARLTVDGVGVAGKAITFFILGTQAGTPVVTDAQGYASLANVSVAGIPVGSYSGSATPPGMEARFAGDAGLTPGSVFVTLVISPATATLTLSNLSHVYDGTPKPATVTTSPAGLSGVVITYQAAGGTATQTPPTSVGSYAVTATLTNDSYTASAVTGTVVISPASQTIAFAALPSRTFGEAPFVVTATSSAGLPVTFSSVGDCTVSVDTVRLTGAGSCTVTASQAGTQNVSAANPVSHSFAINPAQATLVLGNLSHVYDGSPKAAPVTTTPAGLSGVVVTYQAAGGTATQTPPTSVGSYAVTATLTNQNYVASPVTGTLVISPAQATLALSDLAHVYNGLPKQATVTTSPAGLGVVTVTYDGSEQLPVNAGSYAVVATLTNSSYSAAPVNATLVIAKASQTISFDSIPNRTYGDQPFHISAVSSAVLSLTVVASGACSNTGTLISIHSAGTCTVTVSQPGDENHLPAESVTRSFEIAKASATLTLSGLVHTYDGTAKSATVTTTPEGLSGVMVTYNGQSTPPTEAGSYFVEATLNNPNYVAASVSDQMVINPPPKQAQTITFEQPTQTTRTWGDSNPVTVVATASSGLPVSLFAQSGNCNFDGGLYIHEPGTCTVIASQEGDDKYLRAEDVTLVITTLKAPATIVITNNSVPYTGGPQNPEYATDPSGLESLVVFTYDQGFAPVEQGSYAYTATLEDRYYTADPVKDTLVIYGLAREKASQTITFALPDTILLSESPVTLNAVASSGLPVSYSAEGTCSYNLDIGLELHSPGLCQVTATQAGDEQWNAATPVTEQFEIVEVKSSQTIDFPAFVPDTIAFGDPVPQPAATASSGLPVSYNVSGPCTYDTQLNVLSAGECVVTASQDGDATYDAAPPAYQTLTITEPPPANTKIWTGSASSDWSDGSNWSPTGVPQSTDSVHVPLTGVSPLLSGSTAIAALVVDDGVQLDVGTSTLTVERTVSAGNTIVRSGGTTGAVRLTGASATIRGTVPSLEVASTSASLSGPLEVTGALTIESGASLYMNASSATVADSLLALGRLRMFATAETLTVVGNARFSGNPELNMRGGVLRLLRGLYGTGSFETDTYHEVLLDGSDSAQVVSMLTTQAINHVKVRNPAGATFTNVNMLGNLTIDPVVTQKLRFTAGASSIAGTVSPLVVPITVDTLGTLTFNGDLTTLAGGKLTGRGKLTVQGKLTTADTVGFPTVSLGDTTGTSAVNFQFAPDTLYLIGGSQRLQGGLAYRHLKINAATGVAQGPDSLPGLLVTMNSGTLVLNGHRYVADSLDARNVTMATPSDSLVIKRGAFFRDGGTGFTDGTLIVGGFFRIQASVGDHHFKASGNHTVVLNGTSRQTVTLGDSSWFQNLVVQNPKGVMFTTLSVGGIFSATTVNGSLTIDPVVDSIIVGSGSTAKLVLNGSVTPGRLPWRIANNATASFMQPWTVESTGKILRTGTTTATGILQMIGALTTQSGSVVNPATVRLNDVSGTTLIAGTFTPATLVMEGTALNKQVNVGIGYNNLSVTAGSAIFVNGGVIPDKISTSAGAVLNMNGQHVVADTISSLGRIQMHQATDTLDVLGPATFRQSASDSSDYTAGVLRVAGNFDAYVCCGPYFLAKGTHKVVLNGTAARQTIRMGGAQGLANLELTNPYGADLTVVQVKDSFIIAPTVTAGLTFLTDANSSPNMFGTVSTVTSAWTIGTSSNVVVEVADTVNVASGGSIGGTGSLKAVAIVSDAGTTVNPLAVFLSGEAGTSGVSGTFSPTTTEFNGPTPNKRILAGLGYKNVVVNGGSAVMYGSRTATTMNGNLTIHSNIGSHLTINGQDVTVTGNLDSWGLRMDNAADALTVQGNATFQRADSLYDFTDGVLTVGGNFTADVCCGAEFTAQNNHKVVLNGTGRQNVTLSGYQHFRDLEIANVNADTSMGVHFMGPMARVERELRLKPNARATVPAGKILDNCSTTIFSSLALETGSLILIDSSATPGNLEYYTFSDQSGSISGPTSRCSGPPA